MRTDMPEISMMMMICFDRYYKPLIRTKATSPISLPARQTVFQLKTKSRT